MGVPNSIPVTGINTVGLLDVVGGAKVGFGSSETTGGSGVFSGFGFSVGSVVVSGSGVSDGFGSTGTSVVSPPVTENSASSLADAVRVELDIDSTSDTVTDASLI